MNSAQMFKKKKNIPLLLSFHFQRKNQILYSKFPYSQPSNIVSKNNIPHSIYTFVDKFNRKKGNIPSSFFQRKKLDYISFNSYILKCNIRQTYSSRSFPYPKRIISTFVDKFSRKKETIPSSFSSKKKIRSSRSFPYPNFQK